MLKRGIMGGVLRQHFIQVSMPQQLKTLRRMQESPQPVQSLQDESGERAELKQQQRQHLQIQHVMKISITVTKIDTQASNIVVLMKSLPPFSFHGLK